MERDVLKGIDVLWVKERPDDLPGGVIVDQRTTVGVHKAVACRALGVSESWFYKWQSPGPSERRRRWDRLHEAVKKLFDDFGTYGSPRILEDLRDDGWTVSKKTVEASMHRQGLVGRPKKKPKEGPDQGRRRRRTPVCAGAPCGHGDEHPDQDRWR